MPAAAFGGLSAESGREVDFGVVGTEERDTQTQFLTSTASISEQLLLRQVESLGWVLGKIFRGTDKS